MSDAADRVFIRFSVTQDEERIVERLHAQPLGEDDLYCLDNFPFYAYGVSFGDIVCAPKLSTGPTFSKVITHRGHSTYRVRLPKGMGHEHFMRYWPPFEALGCRFEGSSAEAARLYAIDVPPNADVGAVYKILEDGEKNELWTFEEGHYCAETDRRDAH